MKLRYLISYSILALILISCAKKNTLSSGRLENKHSYKIYSYYGCCGCKAKYFTINLGKKKVEQIIYSYNCPPSEGKPTKFIFNYNKHGKIVSCEKLVATTTNDFTMELSEQEKILFATVENDSTMKQEINIIKFSEIKGFRKPVENEITHLFPLIKKGYKLPVQ